MRFALLLFAFWSREGFGKELADESEGDYEILSGKICVEKRLIVSPRRWP